MAKSHSKYDGQRAPKKKVFKKRALKLTFLRVCPPPLDGVQTLTDNPIHMKLTENTFCKTKNYLILLLQNKICKKNFKYVVLSVKWSKNCK